MFRSSGWFGSQPQLYRAQRAFVFPQTDLSVGVLTVLDYLVPWSSRIWSRGGCRGAAAGHCPSTAQARQQGITASRTIQNIPPEN